MRILVTGSAGFIGRHLVDQAAAAGHDVIAIVSKASRRTLPAGARELVCDVFAEGAAAALPEADVLIHLAWREQRDTGSEAHAGICLPRSLAFIRDHLAQNGSHVVVAGTCFEYGRSREGMISEEDQPDPDCRYSQAKHELHTGLARAMPAGSCLQWARLFYAYGPGQQSDCLLPMLEAAIADGERVFRMSPGQQERDFIHVGEIARKLLALAERPDRPGVYNICSGRPTRVIDLVRRRIEEMGADIEIDNAAYPYRPGEAMSSWGDGSRMRALETEMRAAA